MRSLVRIKRLSIRSSDETTVRRSITWFIRAIFRTATDVRCHARRFPEPKMTTPAQRDIEVKFTHCCLCNGHIEESATDPCFIRVETKTGLWQM